MQIFTRQGVYDSKMVNKMKQCLYKKALLYHGSRVDDTVFAFIMSQLLSIPVLRVTGKLSHYIQEGGRWEVKKKRKGNNFPLSHLMHFCGQRSLSHQAGNAIFGARLNNLNLRVHHAGILDNCDRPFLLFLGRDK